MTVRSRPLPGNRHRHSHRNSHCHSSGNSDRHSPADCRSPGKDFPRSPAGSDILPVQSRSDIRRIRFLLRYVRRTDGLPVRLQSGFARRCSDSIPA